MSKRAEKAALKAYPYQRATHFPDGFQEFDRNSVPRTLFQEGYEQAEKDLALTWKDVAKIITIYEEGIDNGDYRRYNEAEWMKEYSQDILRKFNARNEKK